MFDRQRDGMLDCELKYLSGESLARDGVSLTLTSLLILAQSARKTVN
jgi:hypothetical protein